MRETKKITLSAAAVALGAVFMLLGVAFPTLDLTVAALSSLLVVMVFVELGSPYVYLVWLCTSLLGFIFFQGSAVWLEYLLVFGAYPILKAYIEKLPRIFWIPLRLVYANAVLFLLYFLLKLLGMPLDSSESFFGLTGGALYALLIAVFNIAFFAYDMLITVALRIYLFKYRERFKKIFK